MLSPQSKKPRWPWRAAAVMLLLVLSLAVFLHYAGRRKVGPSAGPTAVGEAVAGTNARPDSTQGLVLGHPTNAPGALIGPGVAEMLQLMQEWRQLHPSYHTRVETTGPDLASTTEVFRFTGGQGAVVNRMKTQVRQPISLDFIMEAEGERVRAYFPALDQVAAIDPEQETARFLTRIGWAGESLDGTLPVRLARASFVETGPDYRAMTMVFSGALFNMPRAAGDLFLTIQLDETGRILSLEQLTLGMRVVSKLTYLDEDPARIQEASPKIPATAVATKKTFKDILQEQVNPTKPSPAKPI